MNAPVFDNPVTQRIADFLAGIGLAVRSGRTDESTFLPGIRIEHGGLIVDESRLLYPGDLLHEAGHLAVVAPGRRRQLHLHVGDDGGEEMMAIAWSYAAVLHLGLDPAVVFHSGGYQSGGSSIIENFAQGRYFGVPTLQWIGLTAEGSRARELGVEPYPHMIAWLRDEPDDQLSADTDAGAERAPARSA